MQRIHRLAGRALDVAICDRDLLGRLGGLHREVLHLGGDHGEAPACIAGTRRLDRGVQRQQVGLPRDRR